jgi:hypothetical protein
MFKRDRNLVLGSSSLKIKDNLTTLLIEILEVF